jgi:hypothetical protein
MPGIGINYLSLGRQIRIIGDLWAGTGALLWTGKTVNG